MRCTQYMYYSRLPPLLCTCAVVCEARARVHCGRQAAAALLLLVRVLVLVPLRVLVPLLVLVLVLVLVLGTSSRLGVKVQQVRVQIPAPAIPARALGTRAQSVWEPHCQGGCWQCQCWEPGRACSAGVAHLMHQAAVHGLGGVGREQAGVP